MLRQCWFLVAGALVATVVTLSAQTQVLTDAEKTDAIRAGVREKGALTGLVLRDTGQGWANAFSSGLNKYQTANTNTGFSLRVYTPRTWVEQEASNAAKEYRPFTMSEITEEMLEPVLRVVVYPDMPTVLSGSGMSNASSVEHVVLRDGNKRLVMQPIAKEPFTDTTSSALRDAAYQGLTAKFRLDALCELRGPKMNQEFFIVVVGQGTKEKEFKVKEKHFDRLPLSAGLCGVE
jgi:hypothetical protein